VFTYTKEALVELVISFSPSGKTKYFDVLLDNGERILTRSKKAALSCIESLKKQMETYLDGQPGCFVKTIQASNGHDTFSSSSDRSCSQVSSTGLSTTGGQLQDEGFDNTTIAERSNRINQTNGQGNNLVRKLNSQALQHRVNAEQHRVNAEQHRVNAERLQELRSYLREIRLEITGGVDNYDRLVGGFFGDEILEQLYWEDPSPRLVQGSLDQTQ
jgi:hypothetical protein